MGLVSPLSVGDVVKRVMEHWEWEHPGRAGKWIVGKVTNRWRRGVAVQFKEGRSETHEAHVYKLVKTVASGDRHERT